MNPQLEMLPIALVYISFIAAILVFAIGIIGFVAEFAARLKNRKLKRQHKETSL